MAKSLTEAEKRLMKITTKTQFKEVIEELNITEQQKQIAIMYYCDGRKMIDIAYSSKDVYINEQSVSTRLKDFVIKLTEYFHMIDET